MRLDDHYLVPELENLDSGFEPFNFSSSWIFSSIMAISASIPSSFSLSIFLYSSSERDLKGTHLESAICCTIVLVEISGFSDRHLSTAL